MPVPENWVDIKPIPIAKEIPLKVCKRCDINKGVLPSSIKCGFFAPIPDWKKIPIKKGLQDIVMCEKKVLTFKKNMPWLRKGQSCNCCSSFVPIHASEDELKFSVKSWSLYGVDIVVEGNCYHNPQTIRKNKDGWCVCWKAKEK